MGRCSWLPLLCLLLALAPDPLLAQSQAEENASAQRLICGTVVAVNAQRSLITLRPSNLFGRLGMNLTSYRVKRPIVLNGLHSGDRVTAVLSDSDGMLHRLRRFRNAQLFQPNQD